MSSQIVKEQADYLLQVGEHEGMSIYQIVNRRFGVVEHQDYLLPRVLETLDDLQARLTDVLTKNDSTDKAGPKLLTLAAGSDTDGGHGLH